MFRGVITRSRDPDSIPSGLAWKMAREAATGIDTAVEPLLTGREAERAGFRLLGERERG